MPSSGAMPASGGGMSGSGGMQTNPGSATAGPGRRAPARGAKGKPKKGAKVTGTVLGAASEIPVGGGKIYTTAKVVVTQPARGQYKAFSAVCTHVGCIMSAVVNGTIDCPCHGSQFTITTGAVITGPAPTSLPKKQIKIVDGMVVLV
jgi:Rieske Fe-S protein